MKNKSIYIAIATVILISLIVTRALQGTLVMESDYTEGVYYLNNKKKIKPGKSYYLFMGDYKLLVELEDRESKEYQFEIKPLKKTIVTVEGLRDANLDIDETIKEDLRLKHELILKTPITESFGKIYYNRFDDKFGIKLANSNLKETAIKWFTEQGFIIDRDFYFIETPATGPDSELP